MVNKKEIFINLMGKLIAVVLVCVLVGCSGKEPTRETKINIEASKIIETETNNFSSPTPTTEITPTRTPDLIRPDTVRETQRAKAGATISQPSSTPKPSPSPTLSAKQLCQPFPDSIRYLGNTHTLGYPAWTIRARCQGEVTYFRSPVGDMTLYDYTTLTGRFTYGSPDSNDEGLWVYDYWTELSEKWLDESVSQTSWAPVKNAQGVQLLAILHSNGVLSIASGPFQVEPIAESVSFFAFAPTGDRISYVKDHVSYIVRLDGSQPRKIAEDVYGKPAWALEENAILFPSSPLKIAKLDGSGSFIPQEQPSITNRIEYFCDGKLSCRFSTNVLVDRLLWHEQSKLLVFYATTPTDEITFRTLFVYELSEDLQRIVNRQTIFGNFTNQIEWDLPGESLIDSAGNEVLIGPPQGSFFIHAKINSIDDQELGVEFMWTNPWITSRLGHQFSQLSITDQTQILDMDGNLITVDSIKRGMTIELTARRISPYTHSLFAYRIQIYCDQTPCYLGYEGRS